MIHQNIKTFNSGLKCGNLPFLIPEIMSVNYKELLDQLYYETKDFAKYGKVANYIPALERISGDYFALSLITDKGVLYSSGDHSIPFSIQSISKVFSFTMVFRKIGTEIWDRIGREPSGTAFNSLIQLEHEKGIPRNPFINAGAIVVADMMLSVCNDPKSRLLSFIQSLAGDETIHYNPEVVASEKATGHRNYALAHFMKSFGNIHHTVEDVLDVYFHQCAIAMTTDQLARSFLFLANEGKNPINGEEILNPSRTKRLQALMLTSGLYDESGDFAFRVGMPAKSGVGGGIVGVIPRQLSLAVWSPALNERGNSIAGIEAMERFTTYTANSIF